MAWATDRGSHNYPEKSDSLFLFSFLSPFTGTGQTGKRQVEEKSNPSPPRSTRIRIFGGKGVASFNSGVSRISDELDFWSFSVRLREDAGVTCPWQLSTSSLVEI